MVVMSYRASKFNYERTNTMFDMNGIWFLLIIPAIFTICVTVFHHKYVKVWEILVVWVVSIITIALAQFTSEKFAISDDEIWGYNSVKASYDEPFQYWGTCSEEYACGTSCTGSGSSRSCSTRYCTRYYPCKKWGGDTAWLTTQTSNKFTISRDYFSSIERKIWANSKTIELHRENDYKIIQDGDRRESSWPGDYISSIPIAIAHTYENRTKRSSSIRFMKVTEADIKKLQLFNEPKVSGYSSKALYDQSNQAWAKAGKYFQYLNGKLGPNRNLHIIVLIFRDKPLDVVRYQQGYWRNGNKNEFIICIGATKIGTVEWGDVISWTEVESLKIDFRDYITQRMKTVNEESLISLAKYSEIELGKRFIKPEFTKKYHHLSAAPSLFSVITSAIVVLLVNVGVGIWIVKNDFTN